jgi:hypothetical protein
VLAALGASSDLIHEIVSVQLTLWSDILVKLWFMNDHNVIPSALAQALRWLEPLLNLVPETVQVHVEISGALVLIVAVVFVAAFLQPPK